MILETRMIVCYPRSIKKLDFAPLTSIASTRESNVYIDSLLSSSACAS